MFQIVKSLSITNLDDDDDNHSVWIDDDGDDGHGNASLSLAGQ